MHTFPLCHSVLVCLCVGVLLLCMCVGVLWWSRARLNMFSTGPVVWISGHGGERGWGDRGCLWAYWKCVRQLRNVGNRVGM